MSVRLEVTNSFKKYVAAVTVIHSGGWMVDSMKIVGLSCKTRESQSIEMVIVIVNVKKIMFFPPFYVTLWWHEVFVLHTIFRNCNWWALLGILPAFDQAKRICPLNCNIFPNQNHQNYSKSVSVHHQLICESKIMHSNKIQTPCKSCHLIELYTLL